MSWGNHVMVGTSALGDATEAMVQAALLKAGSVVLLPFGKHLRYDLVIEDVNGAFCRVQCKTGRLVGGTLRFNASSVHRKPNGRVIRRDYREDAELFGVYCPDNGKVYLIPVDEVPKGIAYLRVDPTRSGRKKGVRLAQFYEIM